MTGGGGAEGGGGGINSVRSFPSDDEDMMRLRDSAAATAENPGGGRENNPNSTALTVRGRGGGTDLCLMECGTPFSSSPNPHNALFAALERDDGHTSPGEIKAIIDSRGGSDLVRSEVPKTGRSPLHAACDRPMPVPPPLLSSTLTPTDRTAGEEGDDDANDDPHPSCDMDSHLDRLSSDIVERRVLLKLVAWSHVDAARMPDRSGDLPVHLLARRLVEWEEGWKAPLLAYLVDVGKSRRRRRTESKRGEGGEVLRDDDHDNDGRLSSSSSSEDEDDDGQRRWAPRIARLYKTMAQCVEVALRPVSSTRALCRARGTLNLLPLHIGCIFGSSGDTLRRMMEEYPEGAAVPFVVMTGPPSVGGMGGGNQFEDRAMLPLELLYRTRREQQAARWMRGGGGREGDAYPPPPVHDDDNDGGGGSMTSDCTSNDDSTDGGVVKFTRSTLENGSTMYDDGDDDDGKDDFVRKSDLVFCFHPDVTPYRRDAERLSRIITMIRNEATRNGRRRRRGEKAGAGGGEEEENNDDGNGEGDAREKENKGRILYEVNLSPAAQSVWRWMVTYVNEHDPTDDYVATVSEVVEGLDSLALTKLVSVSDDNGKQILSLATPVCARVIRDRLRRATEEELQRKGAGRGEGGDEERASPGIRAKYLSSAFGTLSSQSENFGVPGSQLSGLGLSSPRGGRLLSSSVTYGSGKGKGRDGGGAIVTKSPVSVMDELGMRGTGGSGGVLAAIACGDINLPCIINEGKDGPAVPQEKRFMEAQPLQDLKQLMRQRQHHQQPQLPRSILKRGRLNVKAGDGGGEEEGAGTDVIPKDGIETVEKAAGALMHPFSTSQLPTSPSDRPPLSSYYISPSSSSSHSSLLEMELGRLCRRVFHVRERSVPVSFVVLPYRLRAADAFTSSYQQQQQPPILNSPNDAGTALRFAELLLRLTEAPAILRTLGEFLLGEHHHHPPPGLI